METKIKKEQLEKLLIGDEFSSAELFDVVKQLEKENERPDYQDFIFFHDKTYTVKRATYAVIRKVLMNPIFTRQNALMTSLFADKWYFKIPFVLKYVEYRNYKKSLADWNELITITFDGDLKEMELENLTPMEVSRLKRIFFRFQVEQEQEKPDK